MDKQEFKIWLRSRSRRFAEDCRHDRPDAQEPVGSLTWHGGDELPVYYRRGAGQAPLVNSILLKPGDKSEYWLPPGLSPKVILDIGANIGLTSRYLAYRFPQATIHAFEPIPANVELLRRNVPDSVRIHPFGLGSADGSFEFRAPTGWNSNSGGYSRFNVGGDSEPVMAQIRQAGPALAEIGIDRADILKIDTEGAEYDILGALPEALLAEVQWVFGELHEEDINRPTDFKALDLLGRWFDIEIHKTLRRRNYFFDACNRKIVENFRRFRRKT